MRKILNLILCILFVSNAFGQMVTGVIMDSNNNPIPGATIVEKGTDNMTLTNVVGEYSMEITSPASVLVYNFIGYVEQEITVADKTVIDIKFVEGITLGEVKVVGSRNYGRTSADSPVAIDRIDMTKISNQNGKVEINQILQYAAPSFNATKQSGSDGADHIDPASLRGLGPDQTLVLINGKRRHQSSLVNVFGTRGRGNSGTDLNAIPASAISRIEVLRDGAAAQYGSDAIAGVINIILHDQTDGLHGGVTYGAYSTAIGGDYAKQIYDTQGEWEPELFNKTRR